MNRREFTIILLYVKNETFENAFSNKQFRRTTQNHKIVKYIYAKMENFTHQNEIDLESDYYTIEHILPESADEEWGDFSNEEINRSVYRLGNLALLEKKLNRDAGVLNYQHKKEIFKKSNCQTTRSIPGHYEIWSEDKVASRQRKLAKAAKAIWKIQELE